MTQTTAPATFEGTTLEEARDFVDGIKWDGGFCPCCRQRVQVYKRHLNAPMAKLLIYLVHQYMKGGQQSYINVHTFPMIQGRRGGGDYAKLVHWGLIEAEPNEDPETKTHSGSWRPTKAGIMFVQGQTQQPKFVLLYLNDVVGQAEDEINISGALKKPFSFSDIMTGNASYLV